VTYAESGLFWSQCFLPSLVIRKTQAGAGKSSLGLLWRFVKVMQSEIHKNENGNWEMPLPLRNADVSFPNY
jgi:hypothetical protein